MRRKDKEISDMSHIETIIKKARVCRLGMVDGDKPYIVPMSFGYQNNVLYFHGALKGLKINIIKKNSNVCFEFDIAAEALAGDDACQWSMKFQSVIGFGTVSFIDDQAEKEQALKIIMSQYSEKQFEFSQNKLKTTAVIKVEIDSMTGKQSGFQ